MRINSQKKAVKKVSNTLRKIEGTKPQPKSTQKPLKPALTLAKTRSPAREDNDPLEGPMAHNSIDGSRLDDSVSRLNNTIEPANDSKFQSLLGKLTFRHEPDLPRSHPALDLMLTILCFAAVHISYLGNLELSSQRSIGLFSALVLMSVSLYVGGMYNTRRLRRLNVELTNLAISWVFAFTAIGLFVFLSKTAGDISRVWMTTSMLMALTALAGIRMIASLGIFAGNKANTRNIVILGTTSNIKSLMQDLRDLTHSQIKVARVFDIGEHESHSEHYFDALDNTTKQLNIYIENQRQTGAVIEQVWVAASENQATVVKEASAALINSSVDVCVVPDSYAQRIQKGEISRYGNTEVVNVSEIALSLTADQYKRVFDVTIASIALLFLGLPMLMIAAIVKLESKGPALFRQKRYGVDGREIEILKFRSMVVHNDTEVQQAVKNDARVTRFGKFIRKTSLDELPQLLNVLNGTMSLVGPRPHAVSHNEVWRREIQGYMLRHKVRPGITGWAQVNGWRGETDTAYKMTQRVNHDLEYIRKWSPWLDLKILVLTVFVGFVHKNAY